MNKKHLFDNDSDTEEVSLKTENEYAKKYDKWREKEELHKLEQKYGSNGSEGSESDSEDESDVPPEVSEEVETQFLKTLSLLKTKDPRIYDPGFKFFNDQVEIGKEKDKELRKVTFADSDDDEDDDNPNIFTIEKKAEIVEPKVKIIGKSEQEAKLKDYLTGKAEHIDDEVERDLAPLKNLWSDPKLNEGEAFLRDYILNKRYLGDDEGVSEAKVRDDEELEEDEKTVEEQGKFERAFNFRFEEPDDEYLKRYPRTMNSIRPKDERRSRKRVELRSRKEQEKQKKMEEIARLKALKLKEIQEKIAKIKQVTGNEDLAFKDEDIEGDFDPEQHDRRMKAIFDEQYYGAADHEKPDFPDLDQELEIENWDKYDKEDEERVDDDVHCEDDNFNMDADYDPKAAKANLLEELKRNQSKRRRNRKRKSKLAELLATEKPTFTPGVDKTYSEFMEEYYKMDCEDVIGDLPTRFKYREVVPNDFGLTVEEILLADDRELTQWVPLKRIVKYRPEDAEKGDVNTYRQKAADSELKKKVLPSLFRHVAEEPETIVAEEKSKRKKKKKKKDKFKENGDALTNLVIDETSHITQNDSVLFEDRNNVTSNVESETVEQSRVESNDNIANFNGHTDDTNSTKKKKDKIKKSDNSETIFTKKTSAESCKNMVVAKVKGKKEKHNFTVEDIVEANIMASSHGASIGGKRKACTSMDGKVVNKKRKRNKKTKPQNGKEVQNKTGIKGKRLSDPLSKLSDERLKAYGLNPKKYRSFLKYKKF
ncbi:protein KRI1 homolog isoform X2 [Leptidea sinapis]|uniref:protein KRI1 homolog isoform X2 n=1 Tax=Leptidea sinapis TaxID=189913 RepID=UPI0021C2FCD5|nr:protein KRI1 homolog isoform X2 [Leptidea sinapis]